MVGGSRRGQVKSVSRFGRRTKTTLCFATTERTMVLVEGGVESASILFSSRNGIRYGRNYHKSNHTHTRFVLHEEEDRIHGCSMIVAKKKACRTDMVSRSVTPHTSRCRRRWNAGVARLSYDSCRRRQDFFCHSVTNPKNSKRGMTKHETEATL